MTRNYEVTIDGLVPVSTWLIIQAQDEQEATSLARKIAQHNGMGVKTAALNSDLESVEINADSIDYQRIQSVWDVGPTDKRVWNRQQIEELVREKTAEEVV